MLGLGAIDILVLLPILLGTAGTLLAFFITAVALFAVGAVLMVAGPFVIVGAPAAVLLLTGLGLMAGAASLGALTTLAAIGCTHALAWYGRLHLRLLRPALAPHHDLPVEASRIVP